MQRILKIDSKTGTFCSFRPKVQCAICFTPQEIILESFESIEEVANILETNFHKLTETEVEIFNKQTNKMWLKRKTSQELQKLPAASYLESQV